MLLLTMNLEAFSVYFEICSQHLLRWWSSQINFHCLKVFIKCLPACFWDLERSLLESITSCPQETGNLRLIAIAAINIYPFIDFAFLFLGSFMNNSQTCLFFLFVGSIENSSSKLLTLSTLSTILQSWSSIVSLSMNTHSLLIPALSHSWRCSLNW